MMHLILGAIGFSVWGIYIITTYYSKNFSSIDHIESTNGYGGYLLSILIIYSIYKFFTLSGGKKTIRFNISWIIGMFLLQLLILCIFYSDFPEVKQSPLFNGYSPASMSLFIHILKLLIYPIGLVILSFGAGSFILGKCFLNWEKTEYRIQFPINIAIGLFVFVIGLLIIGSMGQYNLYGLSCILGLLFIGTALNWDKYKTFFQNSATEYELNTLNKGVYEVIQPKLLSAEIAFFFLSFLISVSLINAIRPMPIGWDDLGVYMNFPKIMSMTGEYLKGASMYSWQLITGTGFLFGHKAAQAFYINQLGGILVTFCIIAGLSLIFQKRESQQNGTKQILSLPIILAAVFYAMPMNIFQQAKDMKLDPALLSISIIGIIALLFLWKSDEGNKKKNLGFLALSGVIIGFAFSIKITTLMLLLGGIGLISYRILGITGFFGYFLVFIAIFTGGNLWKMMNVSVPSNSMIHAVSVIFIIIGAGLLFAGAKRHTGQQAIQKMIKIYVLSVIVFLGGFAVGISPWLIKNITELQGKPTIMGLIGGSGGTFIMDFDKIGYGQERKIKEDETTQTTSNSGITQNEDLGRYFGYEEGLNNYLKLPVNLTFQKNQGGEFTDITFIYLALLPAILIFIRSRRQIFAVLVALSMVILAFYYFVPFTSRSIGYIFSQIELPFGYLVLLGVNIAILIGVFLLPEKNESNTKFKEIFSIIGIYGFLFMISAFGIVWYGIVIYFLFFALIGLAADNFNSFTSEEAASQDSFGVKVTIACIFGIFILTYFIRSSFPHGWNNLKDASYNEFKYNILNQEESIFSYRQDYITPIATLNLKDPNKIITEGKNLAKSEKLRTLFSEQFSTISIRDFTRFLLTISSQTKDPQIHNDITAIKKYVFDSILYPNKDQQNHGGIYRIGTFMTYLISNNRERYFDDSLVSGFDQFFYEPNHEKTIEKMRKGGLKYLLVDLNAATIDKDPRHDLTNRFEHLLYTMKAKNLTLVDTDNICLQLALDEYKNGKLQNDNDFIDIAGTNYESYRTISGTTTMIYRGEKQRSCFNYILNYFRSNQTSGYSYLEPIRTALSKIEPNSDNNQVQQQMGGIFTQYIGQSWFALFEINDMPVSQEIKTQNIQIGNSSTGSTINVAGNEE